MKIPYVAPNNPELEEKLSNATLDELIAITTISYTTITAIYKALLSKGVLENSDFDNNRSFAVNSLEDLLDEMRRVAAIPDEKEAN